MPESRRIPMLARVLAVLFIAAGLALAVWFHRQHVQWSPDSVRDWIAHWPWAPVAFLVVFVLRPFLFIPSALLMAAGGALFGVLAGTLLGSLGGAISALMMFWLARSLGREAAEKRFGARLRAADGYVRDRGAALVAIYTAFPATPLGIAQIACGLSGIRATPFTLATFAGMLPRTALLAWFGDSLAQARWMRAATALLLVVIAILIGYRMRGRAALGNEPPVS